MQRLAALILAIASSACTNAQRASDVFAPFNASEQSVGFGGLWIGMSHEDAERVLGRALPIVDDLYSDACGSGRSKVRLAETTVSIQWADEQPREIEAMFIHLPMREAARSLSALQHELNSRAEICSTETSEHLAACFLHPAGILVLGETAPESHGVRVIMEDCTD